MHSNAQKLSKGLLRSQSVKQRIELKNAKLYNSEDNGYKNLKRGVSSYLLHKKVINTQKSKALLNLEKAIKTNVPSFQNHARHHLSTEQSHPILISKMLKENMHSNVNETTNMMNLTKIGCLTERNHHNRSMVKLTQDHFRSKNQIETNFKVNNLINNEDMWSFKTKKCSLKLNKENLDKIRSLKDKTRAKRKQNSYHSMSVEPTLKFNSSKDLKQKPKIMNDFMIPAVFRMRDIPIVKADSEQEWQKYNK
jgi:hypothetical protein